MFTTIGSRGGRHAASKIPIITASTVATDQTQAAGAAYGDLATVGPTVTLDMQETVAIIWLSAKAYKTAVSNTCFISVAVSGASSVAASDANAAAAASYVSTTYLPLSRVIVLTGLTPGINIFTMKYHNDGGSTWHFQDRTIAVFAP